jgi:hypothetical protein
MTGLRKGGGLVEKMAVLGKGVGLYGGLEE